MNIKEMIELAAEKSAGYNGEDMNGWAYHSFIEGVDFGMKLMRDLIDEAMSNQKQK